MIRRERRARLDLLSLDQAQKDKYVALGGVLPTREPYRFGYEKGFSGPLFQNLSNRIPYVRDPADGDGVGIHTYGSRTERKYTRTGSYISENPPVHVASSLRSDVPHVANVTSIEALSLDHYRVFMDMHSGTVHAVIQSYDKTALTFYRRYYSLLPQPIEEMSSKDVIKRTRVTQNLLTHDDEPIAWLPKAEMLAFIDSERHASMAHGEWKVTQKPLTFVGVDDDGLPSSIDPHTLLAYNFRYVNFK
jgi:hypothetical protein